MSATKTLILCSATAAYLMAADVASAAPCDSLRALTLPHTTIMTASLVPAGPFQAPGTPPPPAVTLPEHCRVAAVLTPSSDSQI